MELQAEQVINAFRLLTSLTEKERKTVFLTRRNWKTLRARKQRNYSCFLMVWKTWPVSVSQLDTQGRRENTTRVTSTLPSPRVSVFAQAFTISANLEPWTGGKKQRLLHARRKPNCKKGKTRESILFSHLACARLSVIADERKKGASSKKANERKTVWRASLPTRFLRSAFITILEPGTGYFTLHLSFSSYRNITIVREKEHS